AEILITFAPPSTAARMLLASPGAVPSLELLACRIGRIITPGATPAMPVYGLGWAAMRPATNVPWPKQSLSAGPCPLTTSTPGRTRPTSCGTDPSTPVSMTPTTTPSPLVSSHTRRTDNRCSVHGMSRTMSLDGVLHRSPLLYGPPLGPAPPRGTMPSRPL